MNLSFLVLSQVVAACKGVSADVDHILAPFDREKKIEVKKGVIADYVGIDIVERGECKMLGGAEVGHQSVVVSVDIEGKIADKFNTGGGIGANYACKATYFTVGGVVGNWECGLVYDLGDAVAICECAVPDFGDGGAKSNA